MSHIEEKYKNTPRLRDASAKMKHVQACLLPESQYNKAAGFESVELVSNSAASINFSDVSLTTNFFGHTLLAPLMIAPMTGGTKLSAILNERWARAAQKYSLAMGVGSQRVALESESAQKSFMVRKFAPSAFIFANLGAAQLMAGMTPEHALRAVDMIDANALFIHINPLQEACQENGDVNFDGMLNAIARVVETLAPRGVPVLAREVGFGLSKVAAKNLLATGVAGIDCAGAGGTSWAKVEAMCATSLRHQKLGEAFGEWGIKTVDSIKNVRAISKSIPLIATGGIRKGIDVAKCIALGANLASMAQPMLKAAMDGDEALHEFIEGVLYELRVAMFACGVKSIDELAKLEITL